MAVKAFLLQKFQLKRWQRILKSRLYLVSGVLGGFFLLGAGVQLENDLAKNAKNGLPEHWRLAILQNSN